MSLKIILNSFFKITIGFYCEGPVHHITTFNVIVEGLINVGLEARRKEPKQKQKAFDGLPKYGGEGTLTKKISSFVLNYVNEHFRKILSMTKHP